MAWINGTQKVSENVVLYSWRRDKRAFALRLGDDVNITVLGAERLFNKNSKVFFFCYKCSSMFNPDEAKIPVMFEDEREPKYYIVISLSLSDEKFFRACPKCSADVLSLYGDEIAQAIENVINWGWTYESDKSQETKDA